MTKLTDLDHGVCACGSLHQAYDESLAEFQRQVEHHMKEDAPCFIYWAAKQAAWANIITHACMINPKIADSITEYNGVLAADDEIVDIIGQQVLAIREAAGSKRS